MKNQKLLSIVLMFVLLLAVSVSSVAAQDGGPAKPEGSLSVESTVNSRIGYQGMLKEGGVPVNGTRDITFRLYKNDTCTTQVGSDIVKTGVQVTNGLFNVALDVTQSNFSGQGIWVRLVIGGTPLGCQEILPAPYALSLRPGATIDGDNTNVLNPSLAVLAIGSSTDTALTAMVDAEDGFAGYFWNLDADGVAVYANGKIASTKKSYLWMSGNALEKWQHNDTTYMDHNSVGGSTIYGGTGWVTTKYVIMPVTIPGTLYGQDVTLTGMDIYWQCSASDLMGITNIRLRRMIDANSYADIIIDDTDRVCYADDHPDGCTIHLDLTNNNVLSANSGILHLVIGLNFASETDWNRIDGIRLTLEHD